MIKFPEGGQLAEEDVLKTFLMHGTCLPIFKDHLGEKEHIDFI